MLNQKMIAHSLAAGVAAVLLLNGTTGNTADDTARKGDFQIHEISVWLAEPSAKQVNGRNQYPSLLPGLVTSSRTRLPKQGQPLPSPIGLLMFYGQPINDLDVELRADKNSREPGAATGQFLAHWPPAEKRNAQLRWKELKLAEKSSEGAQFGYVAEEHWFQQARKNPALFLHDGGRVERFLAYDAELPYELPIKLEGGPDKYTVMNAAGIPLSDVMIAQPTAAGIRVAWLDVLPAAEPLAAAEQSKAPARDGPSGRSIEEQPKEARAAAAAALAAAAAPATSSGSAMPSKAPNKPATAVASSAPKFRPAKVEMALGTPLNSNDPELAEQTTKALVERLQKAGLTDFECKLLLTNYRTAIFESDKLVVLYRVPSSALDTSVSLYCFPEPSQIVRVGLVLVRNADPAMATEIEKLIAQLGDAKWARREAAQSRLIDLGPLAVTALKLSLTSRDPEIVIRAERILLAENESIETPANAVDALVPAMQGVIQLFAR